LKNANFSLLDTDQIIKKKFDESHDADRVILVGGEKLELSIDSDKIAAAVKEGISLSNFKFGPEYIAKPDLQPQIQSIIVPQIEYKTIEIPVYYKEIEYKTIEVPVIIKEIEYKEIEKQVIVKEIEYKEQYYPLTMKIAAIFQALALGALLLTYLLKK
jgi:hypothetical protein